MATRARGRKAEATSRDSFIRPSEMADVLNVAVDTVSGWVRSKHFPPPASTVGPTRQIRLWRRDHFQYYVAHGQWPAEAWPESERGE